MEPSGELGILELGMHRSGGDIGGVDPPNSRKVLCGDLGLGGVGAVFELKSAEPSEQLSGGGDGRAAGSAGVGVEVHG